jgi:hypothetical protein
VIKRDGALKPFDAGKIASALARASAATGEFGAEAPPPGNCPRHPPVGFGGRLRASCPGSRNSGNERAS